MQTILGSGGGIGIPLARELRHYTDKIRLVARNPKRINPEDELFPADLTNPLDVDRAIAGSEIVYVTVGFQYNIKVWRNTWPAFIDAVIKSCKHHGASLVFFDNVYMYDKSAIPHMTEEARINPPSRKGEVRKLVYEKIRKAYKSDEIKALIARAADFYGPETKNSVLQIMVADNLAKDKKAQLFGDPDAIHTYTYTPDAAKGTALLGNTPEAYNQVWHLPTTNERITQREWVEKIAKALGKPPKIQRVATWMIRLAGVFIPSMREFPEMVYQYDRDYVFDSSKFEKRFGIKATTPDEGIRKVLEEYKA